jgi:hypothetical protein
MVKDEDLNKLVKKKPLIKCPDNLEAVYNEQGGFIGRRPIVKPEVEMDIWEYIMIGNRTIKLEEDGTLNLRKQGIKDMSDIINLGNVKGLESLILSENKITEISCLDSLIDLKFLYLDDNKISKISGLDTLTNLKILNLRNNSITELEGLGNLSNLEDIDLNFNKLPESLMNELYYNETFTPKQAAQNLVNYCNQYKKIS